MITINEKDPLFHKNKPSEKKQLHRNIINILIYCFFAFITVQLFTRDKARWYDMKFISKKIFVSKNVEPLVSAKIR